jgi:DNA-binding response OmpR family regulator
MTAGKRILLVDDDDLFRRSLAEQLAVYEEFETAEADTGAAGLEAAKAERYDAILLDVGLPDHDGREVCRLMRRAGVKAPVIMLTAADSFRLGVLLARLRAQLRTHEQTEDAVFAVGPYSFRPASKLLLDKARNRKIRLTEKETAILKYLYRAGPNTVGRDILLDEVWGYNAGVTTHTLETHVYRLRQKIEPEPSRATILVTEPGGYRLVP